MCSLSNLKQLSLLSSNVKCILRLSFGNKSSMETNLKLTLNWSFFWSHLDPNWAKTISLPTYIIFCFVFFCPLCTLNATLETNKPYKWEKIAIVGGPTKTSAAGMHGAAFFASGQGGAEENFIGWGRARHGVKSLRRGRGTTVKLGAFSERSGAVLKRFGAGADQGSHFSRGREGAGRASL